MNRWKEKISRWGVMHSGKVYKYGAIANKCVLILSGSSFAKRFQDLPLLKEASEFFKNVVYGHDFITGCSSVPTLWDISAYRYALSLLEENREKFQFERSYSGVGVFFERLFETLAWYDDSHYRYRLSQRDVNVVREYLDVMAEDLLEAARCGFGLPEKHYILAA